MTTYMPHVNATSAEQEEAFRVARAVTTRGWEGQRCVVLLTPGRLLIPIPCPPLSSQNQDLLARARQVLPDDSQTIAVVAFNDLFNVNHPDKNDGITTAQIASLIPFLGYLLGMAYIGHKVIVFEGHHSAMAIACQDTDLLIVDKMMEHHLQQDWVGVATRVMRKGRIVGFGQDGKFIPIEPRSELLAVLHQELLDTMGSPFDICIRSNRMPLSMIALWGVPDGSASPSQPRMKNRWWWPF